MIRISSRPLRSTASLLPRQVRFVSATSDSQLPPFTADGNDSSVAPVYDPSKPISRENNPYKAHKPWPPDFDQVDHRTQFRFERRYRRRTKLKYTRPRWNRGVKIFSWVAVGSIVVYAVLFCDWKSEFKGAFKDAEEEPFGEFRKWFFGQLRSIWTHNEPPAKIEPSLQAEEQSKRDKT